MNYTVDWSKGSFFIDVFSYLDVESMRVCSRVCKNWRSLFNQDVFWYQICKQNNVKGVVLDNAKEREIEHAEMVLSEIKKYYTHGVKDEDLYIPKLNSEGTSWKSLFFKNYCPHLCSSYGEEDIVLRIRKQWSDQHKKSMLNARCMVCKSLDFWFCMNKNCSYTGCGRNTKSHFKDHYKMNSDHCVCVQLRNLEFWCYKCDRYLGEDDCLKEELERVNSIKKIFLSEDLYQHRKHPLFKAREENI